MTGTLINDPALTDPVLVLAGWKDTNRFSSLFGVELTTVVAHRDRIKRNATVSARIHDSLMLRASWRIDSLSSGSSRSHNAVERRYSTGIDQTDGDVTGWCHPYRPRTFMIPRWPSRWNVLYHRRVFTGPSLAFLFPLIVGKARFTEAGIAWIMRDLARRERLERLSYRWTASESMLIKTALSRDTHGASRGLGRLMSCHCFSG